MASTFTDLGIEKMATGENAGTWGDKTNTNLDIVNTAIAGYVEQSIAGSADTTALTITDGAATATLQNAVIKFTGTISGNQVVTIPDSIEKTYIIINGTSGAHTVQFKTVSGTGVTFAVSDKGTKLVFSDGTNIVDAGLGGASDLDGNELVLDADGDTTLTADTDDQIDIKIAGADDFRFTANTFTALSGSTFVGNLTGNASGTAATVTTAAQSNITSLGTLTTLTVDNVITNGSTIGHTSDTDLITLADGIVTVAGEVSMTTLDIGGTNVTSTAAELNILDGVNSTAAELNALDGITAVVGELNALDIGSTAVGTAVASKAVILDSNKDYTGLRNFTVSGELDAATGDFSGNVDVDGTLEADAITINGTAIASVLSPIAGGTGIVTTGAINAGSITSGFGTIDTGASAITTTGLISGGSLDIDNVLINGTTIGHTDDTDLLTVADGLLTVAGEVQMTTLDIGGTNVAATAAELNIMDGGTSATSTTIVDADRVVLNDAGTMKQVAVSDVKTYIGGGTSWQAVKTGAFTAAAGQGVFVNTTGSAFAITLPAGTIGDEVSILDYAGTFDSNACTITANGSEKIFASTDDLVVSTERAAFTLVFTDGTQGWLFKND